MVMRLQGMATQVEKRWSLWTVIGPSPMCDAYPDMDACVSSEGGHPLLCRSVRAVQQDADDGVLNLECIAPSNYGCFKL